mgnify:CR=1 FL=1
MIFKTALLQSTIDKILSITDNLDKDKYREKDYSVATLNGFQSKNIISLFPEDLINEILFFNNFSKKLFHLHYIEYDKGGSQKIHNHEHSEEHSFILYLNNSDGDTCFGHPLNIKFEPIKGRLVVFSSDLWHYALKNWNNNKKVLVGAIGKK